MLKQQSVGLCECFATAMTAYYCKSGLIHTASTIVNLQFACTETMKCLVIEY